jgi:hypothetical protein
MTYRDYRALVGGTLTAAAFTVLIVLTFSTLPAHYLRPLALADLAVLLVGVTILGSGEHALRGLYALVLSPLQRAAGRHVLRTRTRR